MAFTARMGAAGVSAAAAQAIGGDSATGLTATGSTQATALPVGAAMNFVSTAAASTGVILPAGNMGDQVYVYNGGANTLSVYPPVGSNINSGAANAAFSVATTKSCIFVYGNAVQIGANLSA